ncbi:MAG TPA: DUF1800 domain-containing protein, partial [Fimbriimonadaceae bacterium]|nr:DUF1800 domain-containing protein [Fimbriimonadaceae bacterium]
SREVWLDQQLNPGDEPLALNIRLSRLEIYSFKAFELRDWPKKEIVRQSQQSDLLHAVMSPWQVRERMVDFWTNHFNIYGNKGLSAYRIPTDQRNVIRKNAVGSFAEMVKASSKSTAMLLYLDQQASTYGRPNENYARELMELHTLGVDGGYTQKDVMEVARCFTGWTEERGFLKDKGSFRFDPLLHDTGEKHVLGQTIPAGGGVEDGEKVIDIVVNHPSTARHIARKLCRYYLGDDGPALQGKVAEAYLQQPVGDIPRMLRTIFLSDEFLNGTPVFRRPFDFVVSSLRALDATTDGNIHVLEYLTQMGQPTHMWPMPDGYPVKPEAWNGSVLGRWNFAIALCHNKIRGTSVAIPRLAKRYGATERRAWASAVFNASTESNTVAAVLPALEKHAYEKPQNDEQWADLTAMCLCAPEFQWK